MSGVSVSVEDVGKRVFLLNPPSVVEDELIEVLLTAEYEVYLLKDPARARRIFARFANSIVFVGIDGQMTEPEWERYIRELLADRSLGDLRIGILSYNTDAALTEKYLMHIGVQCGFVALKLGVQQSAQIMLRALDANEARGRRRYVRARTAGDHRSSFNVALPSGTVTGTIQDISSVGMAVRFTSRVELAAKSLLRDLQLKLHATLVHVDGVVIGTRADDPSVYVVVFQYTKGEEKPRHQIRKYIHRMLQESIEKLM